ncbi:DUF1240 domain-containing protein [Rahnella laticis]|uniref:DUF1240 domain-containing protein n=1 Tax=Rahnella laticis TaxID=2787622 RepID=UPI0018A27494|nr:DUF1240 domain-containing protein [Rahnella laticis]MBF7996162.1 DUF1240 domain-containing protein [Rahnella laticis]
MNKKYLQQWLIFKGGAIILIAASLCYIYGVNDLMETFNTKSLFILSDIIEYSGKVIICASGIPLFIWVLFFALKMLFKKGIEPFKKYTAIGYIWMVISVLSLILGFIISFIIPFILMASSYTSCNIGKYSNYYVITPGLCKTIDPDEWKKR